MGWLDSWRMVLGGLLIGLGACNALPTGGVTGANENGNDGGAADTSNFAVFEDPNSDFSTSDVYDADRQIVRLDTVGGQLFWVEDALAFDGWDVDLENNTLANGFFTVRFGTESGERRAYFTETNPPTICDLVVRQGRLLIFSTSQTVPQE